MARHLTALLLATIGLLLIALVLATAYSVVEIGRRDSAIASYRTTVDDLTTANLAYQTQVTDLTGQRDAVTVERDALTTQRDALTVERDGLAGERDALTARVAELDRTVTERERQLSQAREEGARQQDRADNAEAIGWTMAQILDVDNEIHDEFGNVLGAISDMQDATTYRDSYGYQRARQRGDAAMARLQQLFAQREILVRQLGM